jgi:23S rRNA (adenine2503-C2)-methyltransferase
LALSLHSTLPERRAQLLPRAPRFDPADLVQRAQDYADHIKYPLQVQWTLIEGVNDDDAEIDGLRRLLQGKYAVLNLIPVNAVPGAPWRRPSWERTATIMRSLHAAGILTTLRDSAGQDVEAGCGQLRARAQSAPVRWDESIPKHSSARAAMARGGLETPKEYPCPN